MGPALKYSYLTSLPIVTFMWTCDFHNKNKTSKIE